MTTTPTTAASTRAAATTTTATQAATTTTQAATTTTAHARGKSCQICQSPQQQHRREQCAVAASMTHAALRQSRERSPERKREQNELPPQSRSLPLPPTHASTCAAASASTATRSSSTWVPQRRRRRRPLGLRVAAPPGSVSASDCRTERGKR